MRAKGDGRSARAYALKLLTVAPRTTCQLRQRLEMKGYSTEAVEDALAEARRLGLLDDGAYARLCAERGRLKWGKARVLVELRKRGIARDLAEETVEEGFRDEDELERALRLARQRMARHGVKARVREQRQIAAFLNRRGFGTEAIAGVLERLFGPA